MYLDRLRLRLPKGVLPYKEVVNELLFLTRSHQRKGTKKVKKQQILHQQTIEIKQVKQIGTLRYNYSSPQTVEFHPLLRASRDHSTLQPLQLFRSFVRPVSNFFERMQS